MFMTESWLRPNGGVTVIPSISIEGDPVADEERNEDCDNAALVFCSGNDIVGRVLSCVENCSLQRGPLVDREIFPDIGGHSVQWRVRLLTCHSAQKRPINFYRLTKQKGKTKKSIVIS